MVPAVPRTARDLRYITTVLALTVYRFAPRGDDLQRRIHDLIVTKAQPVPAGARMLDIGCGSGSLVVKLAKAAPDSFVTGVDSWGRDWEYSQRQCAENARIEGVADRTAFHQQSAAAVDGSFDVVVSCLTFHEVGDLESATGALVAALRVVGPGGRFAFLDLFGDPGHYPSPDGVREAIEGAGGTIEEFGGLADALPLPFPLRHPKVLGHALLVVGSRPRH
ncbi:hypothetical protein Afe04nite_07790 [Asanoa ferruginea]|uniref:SAM-dependent methyltransferase n=1 Tax=Asanoa ferruginea TaxID=53367 RepID=UPI0014774C97|nr:class I SAM-dependent methyltransferase [Asanoa ferruginea]GIF46240.1 hypothetical protein Afe04nite_07790 [Asanoa ferruginea]